MTRWLQNRPLLLILLSIGALATGLAIGHRSPVDPAPTRQAQLPTPPLAMVSFWEWQHWRQLDALLACGADPRLPPDTVSFLSALIDRRDDLLARNLAANALVTQELPVPGLADRFAGMALDQSETPGWRDFAAQQLTDAIAAAPRIDEAAVAPLIRLARGGGAIAGTALLQLQRLIDERDAPVSGSLIHGILDAALADAASDRALAITALGLAAHRGDRALLPRVRACALSPYPSLRRTAIAALGVIGDPSDREAIAAATIDRDPTVARAAVAAIARIDAHPH